MRAQAVLASGVLLLGAAALAAEPAPGWTLEAGTARRATAISRTIPGTTHYGFACFRGLWTFFVKHTPPEGPACHDMESCEEVVRETTHAVRVPGGSWIEGPFKLFEATHYGQRPFSGEEARALLGAEAIEVRLDPRVAALWRKPTLTLPLDGLGALLERERRRVACAR